MDLQQSDFWPHGMATMFGVRASVGSPGQGGGKVWQPWKGSGQGLAHLGRVRASPGTSRTGPGWFRTYSGLARARFCAVQKLHPRTKMKSTRYIFDFFVASPLSRPNATF